MNEFYVYLIVIIITVLICSLYGIVYISKLILNQRNIEDEIIKTVKEVKAKCEL